MSDTAVWYQPALDSVKDNNDLFKVGLCELSLGLREQCSGATDPWTDEQEWDVVWYLRSRLGSWRPPSIQRGERFDRAIKEMVESALEEWGFSKCGRIVRLAKRVQQAPQITRMNIDTECERWAIGQWDGAWKCGGSES